MVQCNGEARRQRAHHQHSLHLSRCPKEICETVQCWLTDSRNNVRGYETIPCSEKPPKLHGCMKGRQECMGPSAGKDNVCIFYNEMSIYPRVSQRHTPCCSVHLRYRCIPVHPPPVAQSVFDIPLSTYALCHHPATKLNCGGGQEWIFPPQQQPVHL